MSLSARAIALNGAGFNPRIFALNGLANYNVLTQYEPAAQGAGGGHAYLEKTSRNSDSEAYRPERVAERLEAITIAGRTFDPLDPNLIDILEDLAKTPEPEHLPELERQSRKLNRSFTVMSGERAIQVPMFRPMLREMPDFQTAAMEEFAAYSARAKAAALEERRRIIILLSAE